MEDEVTLDIFLHNRFAELPERIQKAFQNRRFDEYIDEIAYDYTLTTIQKEVLENEITLVFFLLEPITHLTTNIQQTLSLSTETAEEIYEDVLLLFFFDIEDILREIAQDPTFVGIHTLEEETSVREVKAPEKLEQFREIVTPQSAPTQEQPPTPQAAPKPLTREEVLKTLGQRRTMLDDIRALQSHNTPE